MKTTDKQVESKESLVKAIKKVAYLEGDFTTRAGKKTNYYIDKYQFETRPEVLAPLAKALAKLSPDPDTYDRIGAPELGAVPLAAVLSIECQKPFIIIKKESKGYGTKNMIEGPYAKGERVWVVEDILTTGGAVLRASDILLNEGLRIVKITGVINRQEGAIENIEEKGFDVEALITSSDLKKSV